MADKVSNVVLNFKMNGQVQYANTIKQINMVMSTASKEYQAQIAAMGKNATMTDKLVAEKKKLETQMNASAQKVAMLTKEFEEMQNDTSATADDLQKLYNQLVSAETAHSKLESAMERVNENLSEEGRATREAKDELKNLSDEMKVLDSEQRKLTSSFQLQNAQLDENASEAERAELAQKQYAQQVELTERVVKNLESQLNQARAAYGDNSKEVNQLESKLNQAKVAMSNFGNELGDVKTEADQTERSIGGLGEGLAALAGAVPAAAIAGLVESTQETAIQLGMLETQAKNAGLAMEDFEKSQDIFATVKQDVGQVTEAMGNLAQAGYTTAEDMTKISEGIAGAITKYGETFTSEGLAESINTTAQLGEVTGQLTDLLEKEGVNVEQFNEKLLSMGTATERADAISQLFASQGLNSMYQEYIKANPEIQKATEAQREQQAALTELGNVFRPIITEITEFTTKLIEWAIENEGLVKNLGIAAAAIGGLLSVLSLLSPIVTAVIAVVSPLGLSFGAIAAPIAIAVAAIGLIGAALTAAYQNSETFRTNVQVIFDSVSSTIQTVMENISLFIQEKWSLIKQFWDENGAQILLAVENIFNGIKAVIEFVMPFALGLIQDTWNAIQNVIDGGLDFILGLVKTFSSLFTGDWKGVWDGLKQMFSGAVEALWGILNLGFLGKMFKVVKGFGGQAFDAIKDMVSKIRGKFDEIVSAGKSKFDDLKNKIMTPVNAARDAVKTAIDKIKGFFNFKWSLPKLKLPKITIKGSFSLNPPRVPSFGIKWFANGGIMTKPTAFGVNGNNILAGGEAGAEAILPLNEKYLGQIGKAIASTMNGGQQQPTTIVVQSVLDGKIIGQSTSQFQYDQSKLKFMQVGGM